MVKRIKEPPPEFFRFQKWANFFSDKRERCCVYDKSIRKGIHDLGLDLIYCHDHANEDGRRFGSICVDPLRHNLRDGIFHTSCHLFTDDGSLNELHEFGKLIGLRRSWFQKYAKYPHYDLTASKRELAVRFGAKEVGRRYIIESKIYDDPKYHSESEGMIGAKTAEELEEATQTGGGE